MFDTQIEVALPYEQFRLKNGLRVVVHEDRKAPVVAMQVMYGVGSKDEPEGKTGFAHLFEHLMFNGSENFDKDFFVGLTEMGATGYNGTTNVDRTNYYQTVPTGALERMLFLESDRMGHLLGAVTQEKLDNQIGVVQNEKRVGEDRPFGRRISEEIFKNLYPVGHPYHHSTIGSMEDLEAATLDDVKAWFREYYGAANAVVVLAGDIDAVTAKPLMERYFGDIVSGPPLMKPTIDSVPLAANKYGVMQDRVAQPRLYRVYVGPPTGSVDGPGLDIMARILGGGNTSRLHRLLVDELQIANSVSVSYSESLLSGQISFIAEVKSPADIDSVRAIIDEQIEEFLNEGPTGHELGRAKITYLSSQVRSLESAAAKASTLAGGTLFLNDPDFYVDEAMDRLQAVTADETRASTVKYLEHGYYELQVLPFGNLGATGEGIDRSTLPVIHPVKASPFPQIEEARLSNGIKVIVAPRPTVPVVDIALQFDAGTATRNIGLNGKPPVYGVTDFATALMSEGTDELSAQDIATKQEELGARISITNGRDATQAHLSALKVNLRPSLDLFGGIVKDASYPQERLEITRARAIDGLRQEKANAQAVGSRALTYTAYGDAHAYGRSATARAAIANIEAITRADLLAWKHAWINADNATIFVTGDTDANEILPELERVFGTFEGGAVPQKQIEEIKRAPSKRVILIDKPETQQAMILAGRLIGPSNADTDTALAAMNDAFGGSFLSRINMNLREDKGWSYGVRSGTGQAKGQRLFTITAPVQIDRTGDSIAEIITEMRKIIGDAPPAQTELDQKIASVTGAMPAQFETARSVLTAMTQNYTYGLPLDHDVRLLKRYQQLTLEDVAAAANQVIDPTDLTWVVVGDASKIGPQLEELDLGEIEIRNTQGEPING
ncbi:M16 family metallopeptidase [Erythrobacter aureus]|uniref:M16 family metallopeptidase n=1 Tax=Erythrobacter aureus TaxID=2182384 RepID=UPI003A8DEB8D